MTFNHILSSADKINKCVPLGSTFKGGILVFGLERKFSADAITHMGYFIPIYRIYSLLEDNDYQFIYDSEVSIDECESNRLEKQKVGKEEDIDE